MERYDITLFKTWMNGFFDISGSQISENFEISVWIGLHPKTPSWFLDALNANRKSKMCSILSRHMGTLVHRTNHSFTLWIVWYPIYPLYSRMNPMISTGRDSYIIEKRNLFFWNFFPNHGFTNNKNRCRFSFFSLMLSSKLVTGDCKPVK